MFPIYILPLLIALVAIRMFHQVSEDISTVLSVATAIVGLIVGFALAPWLVQLGMVILVLGVERLYLVKSGRHS